MAVITLPRPTFAPLYTGSTWATVANAMRAAIGNRKPPLTNAEAVSLVREWSMVANGASTLAMQFAAAAYGWDPPKVDALRTDAKQATRSYSMTDALWRWVGGIADELDARGGGTAHITVNRDTWSDPTFLGAVRAALVQDGAKAPVVKPAPKPKQSDSGSGLLVVVAIAWMVLSPGRTRGRKRRT